MDPTSNTDPFRALDGQEPTPDWDGVLARAAEPATAAPPATGPRSTSTRRRVLAVAAALLVIAGAAAGAAALRSDSQGSSVHAGPSPEKETNDGTAIWGKEFQLERITHDGKAWLVSPASDEPVRFTFAPRFDSGGDAVLFRGCNLISRVASIDHGRLRVHGRALENVPHECRDDDGTPSHLARQDEILLALLESAPRIELDGSRLFLIGPSGEEAGLVDVAAYDPPIAMEGRRWRVTHLVVDGVPHDPPAGIPLTLGLDRGHLGFQGCNGMSTTGHIVGHVLRIGKNWGSTLKGCRPNPDPLVLAVLGSEPVVEVRGDRLVLSRGTHRLEAVALADEVTPSTATTGTTVPVATTTTTVPETTTTTEPAVTTTTLPDGPMDDLPDELYIGPFWDQPELHLTWLTDGGVEQPFGPMTIVDTRGGAVRVAGCNGAGGPMKLEDRGPEGFFLVKDGDWPATTKACLGDDGKLLMDRDAWFDAFLRSSPRLTWDDDAEFTLTSGDRIVKLVYGGI